MIINGKKTHQAQTAQTLVLKKNSGRQQINSETNLAIRGIDNDGIKWGDTFHNDLHKDLKADFILSNLPFNDSDWNGELLTEDPRWKFGVTPKGNANFA